MVPTAILTETVDRVRGSKGNKVLRTRKINRKPIGMREILFGLCFVVKVAMTDLLL